MQHLREHEANVGLHLKLSDLEFPYRSSGCLACGDVLVQKKIKPKNKEVPLIRKSYIECRHLNKCIGLHITSTYSLRHHEEKEHDCESSCKYFQKNLKHKKLKEQIKSAILEKPQQLIASDSRDLESVKVQLAEIIKKDVEMETIEYQSSTSNPIKYEFDEKH